jgi:hypothetical protein
MDQDNKELLTGKRIMAYCTGGVRCEKFTGWLKREGFTDVAQLHGGLSPTAKTPSRKVSFGKGNAMSLTNAWSCPSTKSIPRSSAKTGLMAPHVNATSIARTPNATDNFYATNTMNSHTEPLAVTSVEPTR